MNKTESHWKQKDQVGNYSLDQGGYSGSGGKQSGSGYILKTESKRHPNGQMCGIVTGSHAHSVDLCMVVKECAIGLEHFYTWR